MKKLRSKLVIIFSVCVLTECRYIVEPELEIHPLPSSLDDSTKSLTNDRYVYLTDAETESTNIEKINGKTDKTESPLSDTSATSTKITDAKENFPKENPNERTKRQEYDDSSSMQGNSSEELPDDSSNPYDSSGDKDSNLENFSEGEVRNKKDVTPPKSTIKDDKTTSLSEATVEETTTELTEKTETTEQPSYQLPQRDFFGIFLRFAMKNGDNIQKRSVQGWFPSQDEEEEEHMQAAEQNVFRPLFAYRQQQALRRRLRTPPIF